MKITSFGGRTLSMFAFAASTGAATAAPEQRPELFQSLVNCRSIQGDTERLLCYDKQVSALDEASQANRLLIIDQEQIKKTRRTLFGLTLPHISIFGSENKTVAEEPMELEAVIQSAQKNRDGRWIIIIDDGARWVQIDSRELALSPRSGQKIRIRSAAFGSFFANVNGQPAIRMSRER